MSAASNAKPPRPCTEYNIFFQLERAHIIQVLLRNRPALDPAEIFHPSQSTYAGLPQLPRRYASLVLPYDWHLPGKEKRRKRKHRKSHGVIGFHDLSRKIVTAWKSVNDEVKTYCSQVCAAGMVRYKAAMKEWKRKGGQQLEWHKKNQQTITNIGRPGPLKQRHEEVNTLVKILKDTSSSKGTLKTLLEDAHVNGMARDEVPIPTSVSSGAVTTEEMNQAFENDFALGVELEDVGKGVFGSLKVQEESLILEPDIAFSAEGVPSENVVIRGQDGDKVRVPPNSSIVSISDEAVDMDDEEIFDIWNSIDSGANPRHCRDGRPIAHASNEGASRASNNDNFDPHRSSVFGSIGYTETMQDMQQLKAALEHRRAESENVKRRARRRSIMACSA